MDELTRLLTAAGDGDGPALASFVELTRADVWRFCAHLVDPETADDLTQEVYVRAMRSAPRFRGGASARTWLLSIARRVAADEIRARRRRRRLAGLQEPAAPGPDPSGEIALWDLIGGVDDVRQREAFVLTQVLGLRYAEAAALCGVPVGTIRSRVSRARQRLIGMLDADAVRTADRDPARG
jgi:RNA polymerase sigma-70 factor, ECF subfamily